MLMDLSIIIPSNRPKILAHTLNYLDKQSSDGIIYEIIIVQESDEGFEQFSTLTYNFRTRVIRKRIGHDCGASARDEGFKNSEGNYVVFWDDDNIYYPHAMITMFSIANGFDVGIARIRHHGTIIPTSKAIRAGDIDSMCFCVKREIAAKVKWSDDGGRYNDYRWINKAVGFANKINFSPIIIGEHL